jgi:orotate phosphoribosyltransferase
MQVVDVLRANGANVIGMVAIFTYGFPEATQLFADNNVPLVTLSNYESLLQLAKEKNMFTEAELATLGEWRNNPSTWMQ